MQFSQIFIYNIPSTVMYAVAEAVNWVHVIFFYYIHNGVSTLHENFADDCIRVKLVLSCVITEQWKELCVAEPGWTGFLASRIRNSHKTTPGVAAC